MRGRLELAPKLANGNWDWHTNAKVTLQAKTGTEAKANSGVSKYQIFS